MIPLPSFKTEIEPSTLKSILIFDDVKLKSGFTDRDFSQNSLKN